MLCASEEAGEPGENACRKVPSVTLSTLHLMPFHSSLICSSAVNGEVQWQAKNPENSAVIADGKDLSVRKNGYYLINLRLTLDSQCTCDGPSREACTVKLSDGYQDLMEGWVNTNSCSTGLLATVAELSAGSKLNFSFNMKLSQIDQAESRTHLAVIVLRYH